MSINDEEPLLAPMSLPPQMHIDAVAHQLGRLHRPVTLRVFHCPRLLPLANAASSGSEGDEGQGQGIVLPLTDEEARLFLRGPTHPAHPLMNNGKASSTAASVFPPPRAPTSPRPTGSASSAGAGSKGVGASHGGSSGAWGSSSSSINNNQHNQHNQQQNDEGDEGTIPTTFMFPPLPALPLVCHTLLQLHTPRPIIPQLCSTLSYLILPYPTLPCATYPVLPCLTLPCLAPHCPAGSLYEIEFPGDGPLGIFLDSYTVEYRRNHRSSSSSSSSNNNTSALLHCCIVRQSKVASPPPPPPPLSTTHTIYLPYFSS